MRFRFTFAALVGMVACCMSVRGDHREQVDELVKPLIESDLLAGCVVGVIDKGKTEVYGYGEVTRGKGQTPDGRTVYEIGSVTKAFTGTLLADMVRQGEVKLDEPLADLLPKGVTMPEPVGRPITLVDLASQTSGLPRMPDPFEPKNPNDPYADYSPKKLADFLKNHKLRRAPGEYEYSNVGVGLLGTVLAYRAGESYEKLIIQRICNPLEMNDTRITLTSDMKQRLATPYDSDLKKSYSWHSTPIAPAGALRSTGDDCLKFLAVALADEQTVAPAARPVLEDIQIAWQKKYGKPGEIGTGLCWHLAGDGVTWWHNGQTGGYSAVMFAFPPTKVGVMVLTNTSTDATTGLGEKLLLSVLGIKPPPTVEPDVAKVDRAVLEKYVGSYALSPAFAITVTLEGDRLMAQATGQQKFQIFPESPTKFFYKVVDAQISFVEGKSGKVEKLILHQNGQDVPGVKAPERKSGQPGKRAEK